MVEKYKILFEEGFGEITEKKSRFIGTTKAVETETEAIAFINSMKKKYWDANHNCSAYVIGDQYQLQRMSDDGEPGQTAGRPVMDVILGDKVTNICIVVTRYFGGTLLGTGGLVRAYSKAAKEALHNSVIVEKHLARVLEVVTDYQGIGKIQYIAGQMRITILDSIYDDKVVVTLLAPLSHAAELEAKIIEGTSGRSKVTEKSLVYYGLIGKEVQVFS